MRIGTDNDSTMLKACRDGMELNCVEDEDEDEEYGEYIEVDNKEEVAEVELITDGNDENAALRQKGLLLFHYRCANHLMNLAVGDFLKSPLQGKSGSQISSLIGKARKWCICVKNSSLCAEVFHTHHFNIVAMNETWWNSMY